MALSVLIVLAQGPLIALLLVILGMLALFAAASRAGLLRPRLHDALLSIALIYVVVAPFLSAQSPIFSLLRFALAGGIAACLIFNLIPARPDALRRGGWLVLVFVAYQLVPLVSDGITSYGLLRFVIWIMFTPLAFIRYDRQSAKFALGAVLTAGLLLFLGILMQQHGVLGGTWGGAFNGDSVHLTYARRYTSFLQNPNDLGLFMLCAALFAYIYAVQQSKRLTVRLVAIALTLLATYSMYLTTSRGAFLAVPLVLLFFFLIGSRRALVVAAVVAALGLIAVAPQVPTVRANINTTLNSLEHAVTGSDYSSSTRLRVWSQRIARQKNVGVGTGYGGYAPPNLDVRHLPIEQRHQLYRELTVDNGWLKIWLEEGTLGVLLFIGIFGYMIANAVTAARFGTDASIRLTGLIVAGAAVAMAFRGLSVDLFDINPGNLYTWVLFGFAAAFAAESKKSSKGSASGRLTALQ